MTDGKWLERLIARANDISDGQAAKLALARTRPSSRRKLDWCLVCGGNKLDDGSLDPDCHHLWGDMR
jgi:hypothetical protein